MACLTFGLRWRSTFYLKVLSQGLQCCLKLARSKKGILSVPADSLRGKNRHRKTKPMLPEKAVLILRLAEKLPPPLVFPPAFRRISEHPEPQKKIHGLEEQCWGEACIHEVKRGVHRNAIQQHGKSQSHCDFAWVEEKGGLAERRRQKDKNIWFFHHLKKTSGMNWTAVWAGCKPSEMPSALMAMAASLSLCWCGHASHLTCDVGSNRAKVLCFLHSFRWGLRSHWGDMGTVPQKQWEVQSTPRDWVNKWAHPSWYGKILHMY